MTDRIDKFLTRVLDEQFKVSLDELAPKDDVQPHRPPPAPEERLAAILTQVGDADARVPAQGEKEFDAKLNQVEEAWRAIQRQRSELEADREAMCRIQRETAEKTEELRQREADLRQREQKAEHDIFVEQLRLQKEKEELRWSRDERRAEIDQVSRYNTQLVTLGELVRKSEEDNARLSAALRAKEREAASARQRVEELEEQLRFRDEAVRAAECEGKRLLETVASLTSTLEATQLDIVRRQQLHAAAEKEKAESATKVTELQSALDRKFDECTDMKKRWEDAVVRLRDAQERIRDAAVLPVASRTDTASPPKRHQEAPHLAVAVPVGSLANPNPAWMTFVRSLGWKNAKNGVVIAGLLCAILLVYWWVLPGGDSPLQQRNLELQAFLVRQTTALEGCQHELLARSAPPVMAAQPPVFSPNYVCAFLQPNEESWPSTRRPDRSRRS